MIDRQTVAERYTILKCLVGSQAYGTSLGDSSDRDEKGVCIEPVEFAVGFSEFEQYEFRSAELREGDSSAKSKDGDLDLTIYSLRKFLRLALNGNPTIIELLFQKECLIRDSRGGKLQELAPLIIARSSGSAFLGYMQSQRQKLVGERGQKKVNRPELEEKFGFDTKFAMHMIRLGIMGVELMSTGRISIPLKENDRKLCLDIRKGEVKLDSILQLAGDLETEIRDLQKDGPLQEKPDREAVEDWMIDMYWRNWRAQRFLLDSNISDAVN